MYVQVLKSSAQCAKSSVLCTMPIVCTWLQSCAQCLVLCTWLQSCAQCLVMCTCLQSCAQCLVMCTCLQSCAQCLVMCTCLQSCAQSLVTCTWTKVLCAMSSHVYTVKKKKREQVRETTTSITGNLHGEKMTWKRKKRHEKNGWRTIHLTLCHSMMSYDIPSTNSSSDQQKSCISLLWWWPTKELRVCCGNN